MDSGNQSTENAIGSIVQISLKVDPEDYTRVGKQVPLLPAVKGKLIKRIRTWTWAYVCELEKPFSLNRACFEDKIRKMRYTTYGFMTPSIIYSKRFEDAFVSSRELNKILSVGFSYVKNVEDIPELLVCDDHVTDPYFKNILSICGGDLKFI